MAEKLFFKFFIWGESPFTGLSIVNALKLVGMDFDKT